MKILITGAAGFIGYHVSKRLLARSDVIVGLDNLNDYYDPQLKRARLGLLTPHLNFSFLEIDIADRAAVERTFAEGDFDAVIHLAAQAGVRYSLENPISYIDSNVVGFKNILESCRNYGSAHLVYASSSSVYGLNASIPFSVQDHVDHPVSLYAATKKANELMAHAYSHLFGIPTTGLRFFTVYGPWGRPDMSYYLFAEAIRKQQPIKIFNYGRMQRDFTYIDDIVEGVVAVVDRPATPNIGWDANSPDPGSSSAPYRVYNIGNNKPVELLEFVSVIEKAMGVEAKKEFLPMQPGDVTCTFADISALEADFGYRPNTPIEEGIRQFVDWYMSY